MSTDRFQRNDRVMAWDPWATDSRGNPVMVFGRVVRCGPKMVRVLWEARGGPGHEKWVHPHVLAHSTWRDDDPAEPFPVPPLGIACARCGVNDAEPGRRFCNADCGEQA